MTTTDIRPQTPVDERPTAGDRPIRVLSFRQRLSRWDVKVSPYLYISPFFILFAIVGLFPIGFTADIDPTLEQHALYVPQGKWKAHVDEHNRPDHLK